MALSNLQAYEEAPVRLMAGRVPSKPQFRAFCCRSFLEQLLSNVQALLCFDTRPRKLLFSPVALSNIGGCEKAMP